MKSERWRKRFRRLALATLLAVYFLILVGGIVRAAGAGMGCPDWPLCFGQWIPPTDESQLPENYQEIYADRGYAETEFNAFKTWTEYINRLVGAVIGLLILATAIVSFGWLRSDPRLTLYSVASLILVLFQGWLGSVVVASNLHGPTITVHMLVALVLAALLIAVVMRSGRGVWIAQQKADKLLLGLLLAALALSLVQVAMGTQVRENVDEIAKALENQPRAAWIAELGVLFRVHRSFSLLVLLVNGAAAWRVIRGGWRSPMMHVCAWGLLASIVGNIAVGALLYYLDLPPVLQPVHLLLAAVMFGLQYALLMAYLYATAEGSARDVPESAAPTDLSPAK
jgi:cytochrome c oxidase assembly protein subunit 15